MAHATTVPCSTSLAAHCRHAAPSPSASVPPRRTILHEAPQSPRQQRPKNSNGLMHLQPRGEAHEESCRISRFVIDTHNPARVVALHGASLQSPSGNHLANGLAPPGHRVLVHAPSGCWKPAFPLSPMKRKTPRTSLPPHPAQATEGDGRLETGPARKVTTSIRQASINTSSTGPVRLETAYGQGPAVARCGPWR